MISTVPRVVFTQLTTVCVLRSTVVWLHGSEDTYQLLKSVCESFLNKISANSMTIDP